MTASASAPGFRGRLGLFCETGWRLTSYEAWVEAGLEEAEKGTEHEDGCDFEGEGDAE